MANSETPLETDTPGIINRIRDQQPFNQIDFWGRSLSPCALVGPGYCVGMVFPANHGALRIPQTNVVHCREKRAPSSPPHPKPVSGERASGLMPQPEKRCARVLGGVQGKPAHPSPCGHHRSPGNEPLPIVRRHIFGDTRENAGHAPGIRLDSRLPQSDQVPRHDPEAAHRCLLERQWQSTASQSRQGTNDVVTLGCREAAAHSRAEPCIPWLWRDRGFQATVGQGLGNSAGVASISLGACLKKVSPLADGGQVKPNAWPLPAVRTLMRDLGLKRKSMRHGGQFRGDYPPVDGSDQLVNSLLIRRISRPPANDAKKPYGREVMLLAADITTDNPFTLCMLSQASCIIPKLSQVIAQRALCRLVMNRQLPPKTRGGKAANRAVTSRRGIAPVRDESLRMPMGMSRGAREYPREPSGLTGSRDGSQNRLREIRSVAASLRAVSGNSS